MIVGHVYVIHTALTKPLPKDKITLCICAASDLFFWIDTRANVSGVGQLPLTSQDHPAALTHSCFLDCSRVTTFPARDLQGAQHRGPISPQLAKRIVDFLKASPPRTLPLRYLHLAITNLEAHSAD